MSLAAILIVIFLVSAAYGAYQSEGKLRSRKSRHNYVDVVFEWADQLPAGPRHEGLVWLAPFAHFIALSIIALTTFITISGYTVALGPSSLLRFVAGYSYYFIGSASTFLIAYLWGCALPVNPLYKPFHKPAHLGLCAEGILYAGSLFPWDTFTHFTVNEPRGVIRLWSAFSSGLVLFPLLPASVEDYGRLVEILSCYLPASAPVFRQYAWPGWFLPVAMLGTSSAAAMLSAWLLLNGGIIGMLITALLTFLFFIFGSRMIMQVAFGKMERPAKLQDDDTA